MRRKFLAPLRENILPIEPWTEHLQSREEQQTDIERILTYELSSAQPV